ncbi:GNAT family N-acetyltransferase [Methanobrevibacter sp.]|uniref:GNAT family N-acetyltransferase n=1 Tax=Methanobrevibacter sp. TaxID=66852 RepID=UPI0025FF58F6|nr:GNAT family N-acetyltransferase [Methanobrevibacter sp.]MBQ6512392.1 GNAT family N-acetyltransferase [Methanobrevibacter sp.]
MDWKLKKFDELSVYELYEILKLRSEVFVVEQDCVYQDLDDKDKLAFHLFLQDGDEVIAVLRILPENVSYEDMAIGRVIVEQSHRGQGISREMMKKAIDFIIEDFGKSRIKLSGQAYLSEFYQSLGFRKVSDCYLEDGIEHFEFLYEIG